MRLRQYPLTIIAMAWGTFTITLVLAIGHGLATQFQQTTQSLRNEILYVLPGNSTLGNVRFTQTDLDEWQKSIPQIKQILPRMKINTLLISPTQNQITKVYAVNPDYFQLKAMTVQAGGRPLSIRDMRENRRVIVLGDKLAKILFPSLKSAVGQTIQIQSELFTVIGIRQAKSDLFEHRSAYTAWLPISTYQILSQQTTLQTALILPENSQAIASIKQQLIKLIAMRDNITPHSGLLNFYDFWQTELKRQSFFYALNFMLIFIGAITLLVAANGIANILLITVTHETAEIGLRMAIGATRRQILWHYLQRALKTTLIGGSIGLALASTGVYILRYIPYKLLVPALSWYMVLGILGLLVLIGLLAGWLPARRAANVDPYGAIMQRSWA